MLPTPLVKKRRVGTMFMPNGKTSVGDAGMRRGEAIRRPLLRGTWSKLSQRSGGVGGSGVSRGKKRAAEGAGAKQAKRIHGRKGRAVWAGRASSGFLRLRSGQALRLRLAQVRANYAQDDSKNRGLAGLAVEKKM